MSNKYRHDEAREAELFADEVIRQLQDGMRQRRRHEHKRKRKEHYVPTVPCYQADAIPNRNVKRLAWSNRADTGLTFSHTERLEEQAWSGRADATAFGYISTATHVAAYISQFHPDDVEQAARVLRAQGMSQAAKRCDDALVLMREKESKR